MIHAVSVGWAVASKQEWITGFYHSSFSLFRLKIMMAIILTLLFASQLYNLKIKRMEEWSALTSLQPARESYSQKANRDLLWHSRACFLSEILRGKIIFNQICGGGVRGLPRDPSGEPPPHSIVLWDFNFRSRPGRHTISSFFAFRHALMQSKGMWKGNKMILKDLANHWCMCVCVCVPMFQEETIWK